ncbi:MAG: hypothetical protein H7Z19_00410, partial [Chitinophagaceae bacterium]|nr:hypothetical protein [Rubrivivax sp.]
PGAPALAALQLRRVCGLDTTALVRWLGDSLANRPQAKASFPALQR